MGSIPDCLNEDINHLVEYLVYKSNCRVDYSPKTLYRHVRCGRCSGIPVCCILFFLGFWVPLFLFINFKPVKRFVKWWPPQERFNYVPCFICYWRRNKKKIHVCKLGDKRCCGLVSQSVEPQ
jgi:hypothetical protein